MPLLPRLASVLRTLTRGSQLDADLDDEVRAFVELLTEEKIQLGLSPDAARRAALVEVGGVEQVKEHVRDARFGQMMREMVTDLRSAWRQTRRDGGLSITLLVTIGLAIGVTATVFRIVHAVVLDPVPFHDPDRIVMLWATNGQTGIGLEQARRTASSVTASEFVRWRDQSGLFDALAAIALENNAHLGGATVLSFADADANAEPARVALVSAGFFDVTGVRPRIGRPFNQSGIQDGKSSSWQTEPTVLLQDEYWRRRFDAREDVVGRTVWQGYGDGPDWSRQVVVAGVMPREFAVVSRSVDYLQPLDIDERAARYPDSRDFVVMGRLRSGLSLEDAQRRSDAFARLLEAGNARGASGWHAVLVPVTEDVAGEFRPFMLALLAAVIVLVLVLAVNTATLLLLKTVARAREIGLRQALGAGSARLLRQFMTENMFLAAAGSGLGLLIANALLGWLRQHLPNPKTWGGSFLEGELLRVDGTVVMFAVGSAVLVSVGFGLLPAWHASKSDVLDVLKDSGPTSTGGPKRRRIASALIATQFVLAAILATGSGLLVRSAMALHRLGPGFAHASRLVVGVRAGETQLQQLIVGKGRSVAEAEAAAASGTEPYWLARDDFRRTLLSRMAALPGVLGVTSASDAVMSGRYWLASFRPEGSDANECTTGLFTSVEPNYFAEMQIPRVEGRDFGPADQHGSTPVVIVSREVARRCWPGVSALGRRLRNPQNPRDADSPWFTVVGVVADTRVDGMDKAPLPHVYQPWTQNRWWYGQTSVILRTRGDPMQLLERLRHELASMDKDAYVLGAHRLDDLVYDSAWRVNYAAQLSAGLAAVSLLLAAIGIYGVASHAVRERTREIGLRMALGARARHVTILVLKSMTIAAGMGLVSGLIASCFLTTSLRALLFGIEPFDAVTFAMTAVLLAATTLVAAAVPLWRALALPPLVALRHGS